MVELVQQGHALDLDEASRLQRTRQLLHVLVLGKQFHRHGIREIRHIKHKNGSLVFDFPGIKADNFPPDDYFPYFPYDILDRRCFLVKIPAVKHVGIVRASDCPPEISFAAFSKVSFTQPLLLSWKRGNTALSCPVWLPLSQIRRRKGLFVLLRRIPGISLYGSRHAHSQNRFSASLSIGSFPTSCTFCPGRNLCYLTGDFLIILFPKSAFFLLLILHLTGNGKTASFIKNLL